MQAWDSATAQPPLPLQSFLPMQQSFALPLVEAAPTALVVVPVGSVFVSFWQLASNNPNAAARARPNRQSARLASVWRAFPCNTMPRALHAERRERKR